MKDPATELAEARSTIALYRGLLILTVLGSAGFGWFLVQKLKPPSFGDPDATWTVDLRERHAWVDSNKKHLMDFSETYLEKAEGSVHMHFMSPGQVTPLHLHLKSDEAVLLSTGRAKVDAWWGDNGTLQFATAEHAEGTVLHSPRSTGHRWQNPSTTSFLANLVFTRPKFTGNLYIEPGDTKLLQGTAPGVAAPAEGLTAFLLTKEPYARTQLPMLDGALSTLHVAQSYALAAEAEKPVVVVVAAGFGEVNGHALRPGTLAHVAEASTITAKEPLALLVFDPFSVIAP